MLELPSSANSRITMQVSIPFLCESLAASFAFVGPRLGVSASMVHSARLNRELTLANHACKAELQAASLRIHDVASLQILQENFNICSIFVAATPGACNQ